MRIGITGVAGFVGRHVLDALAAAQVDEVVGLDSFEEVVHRPRAPAYPWHVAGSRGPTPTAPVQVIARERLRPDYGRDLPRARRCGDRLAAAIGVRLARSRPRPVRPRDEGGTATLWAAPAESQRAAAGGERQRHVGLCRAPWVHDWSGSGAARRPAPAEPLRLVEVWGGAAVPHLRRLARHAR